MSISTRSVKELHYILPIGQLLEAFNEGIAAVITCSISGDVEERVNQYVGVFFNGSNPILKRQSDRKEELCLLRLDPSLASMQEAIVADGDASAPGTHFYQAPHGLERLNYSVLYNKGGWTNKQASLEENREMSRQRSAQLLVPGTLAPASITGIYVASEKVRQTIQFISLGLCPVPIIVKPSIFFEKETIKPAWAARAVPDPDPDEEVEIIVNNKKTGREQFSSSLPSSSEGGKRVKRSDHTLPSPGSSQELYSGK